VQGGGGAPCQPRLAGTACCHGLGVLGQQRGFPKTALRLPNRSKVSGRVWSPDSVRRTSAAFCMQAFFSPAACFMAGGARGAFEHAGCLTSRLTNLRIIRHPFVWSRTWRAPFMSGAPPWSSRPRSAHRSSFVKPALLHHFAVCAPTFRHSCLGRQLLGAARHCIKGARAVADALLIHDLSTRTL
jgi:hypothetical protein